MTRYSDTDLTLYTSPAYHQTYQHSHYMIADILMKLLETQTGNMGRCQNQIKTMWLGGMLLIHSENYAEYTS